MNAQQPAEQWGKIGAKLAADVVALTWIDGQPHVLLIRRGDEPHKGAWALPGGGLDNDETFAQAAARELEEETGITVGWGLPLVGVYDQPDRDPRGRVISVAHLAVFNGHAPEPQASDDAEHAEWVCLSLIRTTPHMLAFDHGEIIEDAMRRFGGVW